MKYKVKDILLILFIWGIFIGIPYIISYFEMDYKSMLLNSWWIYAGLFIGTVFYFLFPNNVRNLFCQICKKKIEDVTGATTIEVDNKDEDIQKLKAEVKNKTLIFQDNCKRNIIKTETPFFDNLSKDLAAEKYEKVVLEASKMVKDDSVVGTFEEFKCRTFIEFAYSCMNLNQYNITERITNLQYLISSKYNRYEGLHIEFLLSLCQCYLIQEDTVNAIKTSYKALYIAQNSNYKSSPQILTTIYHIQTRVFIAQDKPIQAVAAAEEGIKYADDKMESILNYLLSSVYFNYFKNPYKAKIYASRSWSKIYHGAEHYNSLVYLYYFSSFFAEDYQAAVDFLENNINVEHNSKHYSNLSYLLVKVGRIKEAKEIAETEITKDIDEKIKVSAKNALAMVLMKDGNYEKAIYLFSDILPSFEQDRDNFWGKYFYAEILYNRGTCYMKLNNYFKASEDIDKAIELNFDKIDINLYEEIQRCLNTTKSKENADAE